MYLNRSVQNRFLKISKMFPVTLVTGPRQCGKTTMLQEIKEENRNYVSLDKLEIRTLAKEDPELFLQTYKPPIIIDEVQYAPNLFPYIKSIVDNLKEDNLYWLTGSQQFSLMKGVSESLSGRVGIIELSPLSIVEKKKLPQKEFNLENLSKNYELTVNQLWDEIFKGGMPKYYLKNIDRETYFDSYIKTYLERDVRYLSQVGDILQFRKF